MEQHIRKGFGCKRGSDPFSQEIFLHGDDTDVYLTILSKVTCNPSLDLQTIFFHLSGPERDLILGSGRRKAKNGDQEDG
jgi:hypothetical protein